MILNASTIKNSIAQVEQLLKDDTQVCTALRSAITLLIVVLNLLLMRMGLDSHNSSKPPASDPHRERKTRPPSARKKGGQLNHPGTTLVPLADPDEIKVLPLDRATLPVGEYRDAGYEKRQVIDLRIDRFVTEFRAQILESAQGVRFVAEFPAGVTRPAQYGASVKANAVYMSMFQLIPYERVQTHFAEQFNLPISAGSLSNFNLDAYERLSAFENLAKQQLPLEKVLHADETGINVNGAPWWLHNASSLHWTLFYPHKNRGKLAMDVMGILGAFSGTLVHDHWKPYYRYECLHALCNAHHLRELTHAFEQAGQQWAKALHTLLLDINTAVTAAGGVLEVAAAQAWRLQYRALLQQADTECPPPSTATGPPKRGRIKRSKARNLLERLRAYEDDVLRFMDDLNVPFTNNQGERDIRMTKVQQKISGCFRSPEGAKIFCRIRSYLSTCRKNGVGVGEALEHLFNGTWPEFIRVRLEGAE